MGWRSCIVVATAAFRLDGFEIRIFMTAGGSLLFVAFDAFIVSAGLCAHLLRHAREVIFFQNPDKRFSSLIRSTPPSHPLIYVDELFSMPEILHLFKLRTVNLETIVADGK